MIPTIRIDAPGGPDVMKLVQTDLPSPGAAQVLVRHQAVGVNYIDTYHRSGLYPLPMPSGIGMEASGTVEAVGDGVHHLRLGDRVAYCSGPIGAYSGAHVVNADRLVAIPDGLAPDIVAASLLKGLTAQYLVRQIWPTKTGDTVLFHAGAGGVGQIAVQWLKSLGATVIATVGSRTKTNLVTALGVDHVIDTSTEPIAERVRALTDGRGVDVVFDGVGKDTFVASLDSLRMRGLMVSFGNASGPVRDVDLGILSAKGSLFVTRPTLFHYTATRQALEDAAADFFGTLARGAVKIAAPQVYPLAEAAQAHRDLESRKTTGSLILRP